MPHNKRAANKTTKQSTLTEYYKYQRNENLHLKKEKKIEK